MDSMFLSGSLHGCLGGMIEGNGESLSEDIRGCVKKRKNM
jgi:hypothetical protein